MNQKATDLHDEFKIDHQVFLAHFQRLDLSNAKLEKKIRLQGINALELDDPYGKKAKWALHTLVKGQTITAHLNGEKSYDRIVSKCYFRIDNVALYARGCASRKTTGSKTQRSTETYFGGPAGGIACSFEPSDVNELV